MLIWIEREDAQKNAPATGCAAGANAAGEAATLDDSNDPRALPDAQAPIPNFNAHVPGHEKRISTLAAKFALLGLELNCVRREGRQHFEVGDYAGTYAVTTEADLNALLVRFGGAP